jgi:hypothetical protein
LKHTDLDVLRPARMPNNVPPYTCDSTAVSKLGASSLGGQLIPTPESRWLAADFCVEIIIGDSVSTETCRQQATQTMWRTLHADAFCLARDLKRAILTGQPLEVRCDAPQVLAHRVHRVLSRPAGTMPLPGCTAVRRYIDFQPSLFISSPSFCT